MKPVVELEEDQVKLPVRVERTHTPTPAFTGPKPMTPTILTEANSGPRPKPCDGVARHVSTPEVQAQEVKQGWEHMPCGVHGAPWRVSVVLKSVNDLRMSACAFATHGRTMPVVEDLIKISQSEGTL